MKTFAYAMLLFGVLLTLRAIKAEQTGVAVAATPGQSSFSTNRAEREDDPRNFRNLMFYMWAEAGGVLFIGVVVWSLVRREDTLDPLSDTFVGSKAVEDLERTLAEEEERRNRPHLL